MRVKGGQKVFFTFKCFQVEQLLEIDFFEFVVVNPENVEDILVDELFGRVEFSQLVALDL